MTTTYMRIDKEEFRVIYKALRKLLEQGNLSEYSFDREISEHLMEEIQKNIFFCGTTRKNWQVVDWNDPAGNPLVREENSMTIMEILNNEF